MTQLPVTAKKNVLYKGKKSLLMREIDLLYPLKFTDLPDPQVNTAPDELSSTACSVPSARLTAHSLAHRGRKNGGLGTTYPPGTNGNATSWPVTEGHHHHLPLYDMKNRMSCGQCCVLPLDSCSLLQTSRFCACCISQHSTLRVKLRVTYLSLMEASVHPSLSGTHTCPEEPHTNPDTHTRLPPVTQTTPSSQFQTAHATSTADRP